MSSAVDLTEYLRGLPRRVIEPLQAGTPIPKFRISGTLRDYNGFTGRERLRTFELAKWLISHGAMQHSGRCSICGGPGDQHHAEDYFDLETWMDICRSCHSSLHHRFRSPEAWQKRITNLSIDPVNWARNLPSIQIDVAAFHRSHGRAEPTPGDFVAAQHG